MFGSAAAKLTDSAATGAPASSLGAPAKPGGLAFPQATGLPLQRPKEESKQPSSLLGASSKPGGKFPQPAAGGGPGGGGGGGAKAGEVEPRASFAVEYQKQRDLKDKKDKGRWKDEDLAKDTSLRWEK